MSRRLAGCLRLLLVGFGLLMIAIVALLIQLERDPAIHRDRAERELDRSAAMVERALVPATADGMLSASEVAQATDTSGAKLLDYGVDGTRWNVLIEVNATQYGPFGNGTVFGCFSLTNSPGRREVRRIRTTCPSEP